MSSTLLAGISQPPPERLRRAKHPVRHAALLVLAVGAAYLGALATVALTTRPQPARVAIVLGNAVTRAGQPEPRLRARLDTAIALYRHGTVRQILVSGGFEPRIQQDEATVMGRYLRAQNIPAAAILEDHAGNNTYDTARNTAALFAPSTPVVAVSQWFHLPRTMLILRRFGMQHVSGDWPRWFELRDAYSFLREAGGLPIYAFRPVAVAPAPAAPRPTGP